MKIGAIDIGTNSMRLLTADLVDGKLNDRKKYVNTTRIGQGVDENGFITEEDVRKFTAWVLLLLEIVKIEVSL